MLEEINTDWEITLWGVHVPSTGAIYGPLILVNLILRLVPL